MLNTRSTRRRSAAITPSNPTTPRYFLATPKLSNRLKSGHSAQSRAKPKTGHRCRRQGVKKNSKLPKPRSNVPPESAISKISVRSPSVYRDTRAPSIYADKNMYEVERVIGAIFSSAGFHYVLVKWRGYDSSENTWELESNLNKCAGRTVKEFYAKYGKPNWKKHKILSKEGERQQNGK